MGFISAAQDILEGLAGIYSEFTGSTPEDLIEIGSADDPFTLITASGERVGGIRIDGFLQTVGREEFEKMVGTLFLALAPRLRDVGHAVHFFALRDPEGAADGLNRMQEPARQAMRHLEIDQEDVLDARVEKLAEFCANEVMIIEIWTKVTVLSKIERKAATEARQQRLRTVPRTEGPGQPILATYPEIVDLHEAFVSGVLGDIERAGILAQRMTRVDMLRAARMQVAKEFTSDDYRPVLPGDKMPVVLRKPDAVGALDASDMQYPPLAWQLWPHNAERIGLRTIKIGHQYSTVLALEIPPVEVTPFSTLFAKLVSANIPWSVRFSVFGGGLQMFDTKAMVASLLAFLPGNNKAIADAASAIQDRARNGDPSVRIALLFRTWADDETVLRRRAALLAQAVSTWGQASVIELLGDALAGCVSAVPFLTSKTVAPKIAAPLGDVVRMLPIFRPATAWKTGSIIYRSPDGKPLPLEVGDSEQSTWLYVYMGRPGYGKSAHLAVLIYGTVQRPGQVRLPRIGVIDIGPSSRGTIESIGRSLPAALRHQVMHTRLIMDARFAVNYMDTELGLRAPHPAHRSSIINFVSRIVTPAEASRAYESMSQLVAMVIDEAYERYSDEGKQNATPKRYSRGEAPDVDHLLAQYGFEIRPRETTWWQIVDYLFERGHTHEASIAQRYAMPLLPDLASAVQANHIIGVYGNVNAGSGHEKLVDAFSRLISDACREFPIFTVPTRFDLGEARIVALDIEDVTKGDGDAARRQTEIMYLLAKRLVGRTFSYNATTFQHAPLKYRDYLVKMATEAFEDLKLLILDEFHRASKGEAVINEVEVDAREGRKRKLILALSSQSAEDFPPILTKLTTGLFMHDIYNEASLKEIALRFGLSDSACAMARQFLRPPTGRGSAFLSYLDTKKGKVVQLMYLTLSALEIWTLSTTTEDVGVRDRLSDRLGARAARRWLAINFPRGDGAMERIKEIRSKNPEVDAIAVVAQELESSFREQQAIANRSLFVENGKAGR